MKPVMTLTADTLKNKISLLLSFILLVLLFSPTNVFSQWYYQNPKPVGNHLNKVKFFNKNTAWAVGEGGIFIKTSDGGEHWEQLPNTQAGRTTGLFVRDSLTAWSVGFAMNGTVINKTTDGWKSRSQLILSYPQLMSIFFIDENNGWCCGDSGIILKTTDGGSTWHQKSSGTNEILHSIAFFNQQVGIAVGNSGVILRTTDAGESWSIISQSQGHVLNTISIVDGKHAWVANTGSLLHTDDAGETWTGVASLKTGSIDVCFLDTLNGWIISTAGHMVFRTTDGGSSWILYASVPTSGYSSIDFADTSKGCAVGYYGNILVTNDGGATWECKNSGYVVDLYGVFAYDEKRCWAVGHMGAVMTTTDGGETWNPLVSGFGIDLVDICFVTPLKGWAVGNSSDVFYSEDGGNTWQRKQPHLVNGYLTKIFFIDENTGWICGEDNSLIKTNDGGQTWEKEQLPEETDLYDIYFIDDQRGWCVGRSNSSALILSTTNGGANWTRQMTGVSNLYIIKAVNFISSDTGFVLNAPGEVYRTFNGGQTWENFQETGSYPFYDMHFSNSKAGYIAGIAGISYTPDGGLTFEYQRHLSIRKLSFINGFTGWAVGLDGLILKTTNGGYPMGIEKPDPIPMAAEIWAKTYPNPVNPNSSITIDYCLNEKGNTSIFLIDLNGSQLFSHDLGPQNAGDHYFKIPARDLKPGLYFVQIRSSNKVINKKIVVLD